MHRLATLCLAAALTTPYALATTRNVPSQYSTVQAAVNAAASGDTILIAAGTYNEQVTISSSKSNLIIEGSSRSGSIVSSGANQITVLNQGTGITFENLTLRNTSTANTNTNHVLRNFGAKCIVKNANIDGWEDTLYSGSNTQMYVSNCLVQGAVDFVYGNGRIFLTGCTIEQMRASPTGGTIAAPNTDASQNYGIVFSSCTVTSAAGVPAGSTWLGRPWGANGECAFINCTIGSCIGAAGWIEFQGTTNSKTARIAEYVCPSGRVSWDQRLTSTQAAQYTKSNVLGGWNPN
ncbi:MAG TPA: pectinesterase family protein [Opitutaceae bacterium]|nr:pectinesterase family protein [Opitutaceae bacterium]